MSFKLSSVEIIDENWIVDNVFSVKNTNNTAKTS